MTNKVHLTEQAQALGITVDPEWTKAQIIDAINAHESAQGSGGDEMVTDARQKLLDRAVELNIEGAEGMDDKQLAVAIEQVSEPRITITVPKRVVTLNSIVVEEGEHQLTEFDLHATGLLPHQYTRADEPDE